jgi:hypothetical protein
MRRVASNGGRAAEGVAGVPLGRLLVERRGDRDRVGRRGGRLPRASGRRPIEQPARSRGGGGGRRPGLPRHDDVGMRLARQPPPPSVRRSDVSRSARAAPGPCDGKLAIGSSWCVRTADVHSRAEVAP